jgi:hypothetical protein
MTAVRPNAHIASPDQHPDSTVQDVWMQVRGRMWSVLALLPSRVGNTPIPVVRLAVQAAINPGRWPGQTRMS